MMNLDFNGILFALSHALDCVEHDLLGVTTNHGKRVAAIALEIGAGMGVFTELRQRQTLAACAVMHDCALSEYVQDEFGGSYTAAARTTEHNVGKHCIMGEASMKLLPFDLGEMQGAVLYHHENANGSGPFKKKGEEIPQSAKLLQIADTVDTALDLSWVDTAKRERLIQYIKKNIGRLFDTPEAEAFLSWVKEDNLEGLRDEKINLHLRQLLPVCSFSCTGEQLMDFASVFARIVDYKSHFTKMHSIGIAQKAHKMALFYGAADELAARLYFAGALHDIGKLAVDRDILEKPDKLDNLEYRHIQSHAYRSFQILSDMPGMEEITKWAAFHHEKLDGSGYPFKYTADKLDRWSRMMACLDIYQALTESRPYKSGMSHEKAMGLLSDMAKSGKLDAQIVADIDCYFGEG